MVEVSVSWTVSSRDANSDGAKPEELRARFNLWTRKKIPSLDRIVMSGSPAFAVDVRRSIEARAEL